jgi:Mg-chelatase subunit ChlD
MISTKLTTINQHIKSCQFIPEPVRALVQRRTADNKHFGKLEICAPLFNQYGDDEKEEPQRIIAGFLLDTSGSMDGIKLQYAVNTIRKFVEVIHEERNGKTIDTQPFHAWMYLITFNSKAELVIPFQEITEITIPKINECLDKIRTDGSTNYEAAFEKQTQVLEEIIQTITEPTTILRFFETDGEITQGTMNKKKLY